MNYPAGRIHFVGVRLLGEMPKFNGAVAQLGER